MKRAVRTIALTSVAAITDALRGMPSENGQLAEAVAGTHHVDPAPALDDLRAALLEHHELVTRFALEHQRLAGVGGQLVGQSRQFSSPALGHLAKDLDRREAFVSIRSKLPAFHVAAPRGFALPDPTGLRVADAHSRTVSGGR